MSLRRLSYPPTVGFAMFSLRVNLSHSKSSMESDPFDDAHGAGTRLFMLKYAFEKLLRPGALLLEEHHRANMEWARLKRSSMFTVLPA